MVTRPANRVARLQEVLPIPACSPVPMDDVARKPCLSSAQILPLLGLIISAGLDPANILARAGLASDLFSRGGAAPVALTDYFRICEQLALQGKDESCHVSLRPLMVGTSEFVQARLGG